MATKKQVADTRRFVESLLDQRLKELADAHARGDRNAIVSAAGSVRACEDFLNLLTAEERTASD